jgi:hypothetical protein
VSNALQQLVRDLHARAASRIQSGYEAVLVEQWSSYKAEVSDVLDQYGLSLRDYNRMLGRYHEDADMPEEEASLVEEIRERFPDWEPPSLERYLDDEDDPILVARTSGLQGNDRLLVAFLKVYVRLQLEDLVADAVGEAREDVVDSGKLSETRAVKRTIGKREYERFPAAAEIPYEYLFDD